MGYESLSEINKEIGKIWSGEAADCIREIWNESIEYDGYQKNEKTVNSKLMENTIVFDTDIID